MRNILLFLAAMAASTCAHAEITKWVDSEGRVHYSDQPPSTGKTETLKIQSSPAPSPAKEKGTAEKETEFRKRRAADQEAQAKQEKEQQEAKQKQENCTQARNTLRKLQEGGRSYSYDDKGERVYLDDAARQKAISQAQQSIDSWCK